MATGPRYSVRYRRRREGLTNYKARLALLKSRMPRAVVRRSNRLIRVQFVNYKPTHDEVAVAVDSRSLKTYGWKEGMGNTSAAYLTGYICGLKALNAGIDTAVLDIGLATPSKGNKVFAALKGLVDAGVSIPHSADPIPDMTRIGGLKGDEWQSHFNEVLGKIQSELGSQEGI